MVKAYDIQQNQTDPTSKRNVLVCTKKNVTVKSRHIFLRVKVTNRIGSLSHIKICLSRKVLAAMTTMKFAMPQKSVQMFWSKKKRNYVDVVNCRKSVWTMVKSEKQILDLHVFDLKYHLYINYSYIFEGWWKLFSWPHSSCSLS